MNNNDNIEGLQEFQNLLNDLDSSIRKEVMKKGAQRAARPLIEAARAGIVNIKRLQKAIGVIYNQDENAIYVGARSTKRYAGFFANFFESGTKERQTKIKKKRKSHSTGKITATHFWSTAVQQTETEVYQGVTDAFEDAYNSVLKKYEKYYR